MRRALLIALLVLAFPAAARAESVKVAACVPALDPLARSATFEARTRAYGHDRMQVRFTLQVRESALTGWRRVEAPGFDAWLTSDAGVRRYSYARTVENLAAPASYRVVVRFRWLDEDGEPSGDEPSRTRVADRSRRTSAACRQPDLRPNLVPRRVEVAPADTEDQRRYVVYVRNPGPSDAGPFAVGLRVGDLELDPQLSFGLATGLEQAVTFLGPPCIAGTPLTVTTDAAEAVDERDEADNVLVARCRP